jgi:hypothetical protein
LPSYIKILLSNCIKISSDNENKGEKRTEKDLNACSRSETFSSSIIVVSF